MLQVREVHGQDVVATVGTPASTLSHRRRIGSCQDLVAAHGSQNGGRQVRSSGLFQWFTVLVDFHCYLLWCLLVSLKC